MSSKVGEYIRAHVLGLLAIIIALSGTAIAAQQAPSGGGPSASASVVTDAKFKKLKRRVAALEAKPTPTIPTTLPPSGGAGGDLTGAYPNPQIGPGAVGAAEIADRAVTAGKFYYRQSLITNQPPVDGESCISPSFLSHQVPGLEVADHVVVTPPAGFPATFTLTGVPDSANDKVDIHICNHFPGGGSADPDGPPGTQHWYKLLVIRGD